MKLLGLFVVTTGLEETRVPMEEGELTEENGALVLEVGANEVDEGNVVSKLVAV